MTSSFWNLQTRAAFQGINYSPAGYFFAVDGTAYPGAPLPPVPILNDGTGWWAGFSSGMWGGLCNMQDGLWQGGCIGYPAATVPMEPSWKVGVTNLATAVEFTANNYKDAHGSLDGLVLAATGYSQGAIVVMYYFWSMVWPSNGEHHYLLPYWYRLYLFGNPLRTPGENNGNALAGLPTSIKTDGYETGGIGGPMDMPLALSQLTAPDGRPLVNSCTNSGDIYGAAPTGTNTSSMSTIAGPGKVGCLIFNAIQNPSIINIIKIATVLAVPVGAIEEMINGMIFGVQGTNAPHWKYFPQMDACITDMLTLGNMLPHQGC